MTDSCYQFNFQATLSWTEAWISCQQQGADLLSITKLREQMYINGTHTPPRSGEEHGGGGGWGGGVLGFF